MIDHEEERRRQEQARAIDIYRASGAVIKHEYLERRQEIVAVNKTDLEDIRTFDSLEQAMQTLGLFLLSGALWLGLDKIMSQPKFELTPVVSFCSASVVFGLLSLVAGLIMRNKKRARISRIFSETTTH